METLVKKLNQKLEGRSAQSILSFFINEFDGTLAFGTSLGAEDQVITDMIAKIDKSTKIFTWIPEGFFLRLTKLYNRP
jgi:phosphoadenosine phosphosulfate reductase